MEFKINKTNQTLFKTIHQDYGENIPDFDKSLELWAPYKENRSATEHDLWKQKKKANIEEKINKNKKETVSM